MPSRVDFLHHLISSHRQQGISPAELHANKRTIDSFAGEADLTPIVPPDTRSLIERVVNRKPAPGPCLMFDGCKLVVNPRIGGNAILIRPAVLLDDPEWLNKIMWHAPKGPQGQQLIMPEGTETPWHQPADQAIAGVEKDAAEPEGTLQALTRAGGVTPTDIVLKAMEGMDRVEDILVVRFHKGGDVDLCASMDRMRVMGALQVAMAYVARQDY